MDDEGNTSFLSSIFAYNNIFTLIKDRQVSNYLKFLSNLVHFR